MSSPSRGNRYMLGIIIIQFLASLAFSGAIPFINIKIENTFLQIIFFQAVCFLLPLVAYLMFTKKNNETPIPLKPLDLTNVGLIILMCLAIQPLMMLLSAVSSLIFPNKVGTMLDDIYSSNPIVVFFTIAIVPAILEEFTLRGVVLKNYQGVKIKQAALINGLFFGIMHLDLQQFFYAFVLGVIFSYFVHYTQSVFASILGHLVINGSQVVLAIWSMNQSTQSSLAAAPTAAEMINMLAFLSVSTAIFIPTFIIVFRIFLNYNRLKNLEKALTSDNFFDFAIVTKHFKSNIFTPSFWAIVIIFISFAIVNTASMFMNII